MSLSYVTKYRIKEIIYTLIFFFVFFIVIITTNDFKDIAFINLLAGVTLFSIMVIFYELLLSKKIYTYLGTPYQILFGFIYTAIVFAVTAMFLVYIDLIFNKELTIDEIQKIDIYKTLPKNIYTIVFSFFMFLTIRYLLVQFRTRIIKGTVKKYIFKRIDEPVKDVRIFMFMDLISSTSYAEKLGYSKYSNFIQDIYKELDEFVLETNGDIYQYVGDEVVIVWSLKSGLKDLNALKFYYLFENRLNELREYFEKNYNVFPSFKAGYHYGEVAIAEVGGILRRDIAFHGDAVNTTARICSKCTRLKEQVLISGDLVSKFKLSIDQNNFESVGVFRLKGKKVETELFRIKHNSPIKQI
ncbi:MAG: adenylate/guanylate cyclase domain-containing protein [Rhodothermaceae bacterium]